MTTRSAVLGNDALFQIKNVLERPHGSPNKGNFDIFIDSKKYVGEICDIPFV